MDEYIEKYAAIKELQMVCTQSSGGPDAVEAVNYTLNYCKEKVAAIPAADVAPVRYGRWVLIRPGEWNATLKCSECGRHITVDPKQGDLLKDYPYCHCGAKMDGEDEFG